MSKTQWQLPIGVSKGTWDYAESENVATQYDNYFAGHAMFKLDQAILDRHLRPGKRIIDLGCGTARALIPLVERGLTGVGVDLSLAMLREAARKQSQAGIGPERMQLLQANLVDLDCVAEASFDYAICLFSTFGMIRGEDARKLAFQHASRVLVPGGLLVLQVHNYWSHLFDPEGPWWMMGNLLRSRLRGDVEIGDKFFAYRGIPEMFLHSFTKRELKQLIEKVGLKVVHWCPLNRDQSRPLRCGWLADEIRATGWIVVARKMCLKHTPHQWSEPPKR